MENIRKVEAIMTPYYPHLYRLLEDNFMQHIEVYIIAETVIHLKGSNQRIRGTFEKKKLLVKNIWKG